MAGRKIFMALALASSVMGKLQRVIRESTPVSTPRQRGERAQRFAGTFRPHVMTEVEQHNADVRRQRRHCTLLRRLQLVHGTPVVREARAAWVAKRAERRRARMGRRGWAMTWDIRSGHPTLGRYETGHVRVICLNGKQHQRGHVTVA